MRRAESASWRFAEGIVQMPVVALFVRDAVGLGVPPGAALPPRLDGELPDRSGLVSAGQRRAAGAEWVGLMALTEIPQLCSSEFLTPGWSV